MISLKWSAWMPLAAAHPLALQQMPESPGIFRLRREGSHEICHVGAAERGLRLQVERLARQIQLRICPSSADPLAVRLWRIHRDTGSAFQISVAAVPAPALAVTLHELTGESDE